MDVFAAGSMDQANTRLVGYARKRFREVFASETDEKLRWLVVQVRERSIQHGIAREEDVGTALDLTIMYGPEFYEAEWASDVFLVPEWEGSQRMTILRERVRRRVPGF